MRGPRLGFYLCADGWTLCVRFWARWRLLVWRRIK